MSRAKTPRATDEVREVLEAYPKILKRIDNAEKRIAYLEQSMGAPSIPNITGMPSGGRDGSSKVERDVIKKAELEERLQDMYQEESRIREEIEALIDLMEKPDQQIVIEMHYLDGARWRMIAVALYGDEPDYDESEERYLKRTFQIHGAALLTLARIYKEEKEGDTNGEQ